MHHVIFPAMLIGYGSSQHCSYALMYTCTHMFTHAHTHYTPAVAVSGSFWAPWCVYISSALFCWRKMRSCWRFLASLRQGAWGVNFCWGRRRVSQGGRNTP